MKNFKNYIAENSFYTTQAEKDNFINDDKAIMNAFIFGFIGMVSMLNVVKDSSIPKVKMHFKQDQKVRVDSITDDNHDVSLIIKIMLEKNFFKTPATVNQITRFLAKMKTGTVDTIDEAVVRDWLDQIKADKMLLLSTPVKKRIKAFVEGGTLNRLAHELKDFAVFRNSGKMKDTEYFKLAKLLKFDVQKIKAGSTASAPVVSDTADTPVKTPDSTAEPTKPAVKTTKPSKPAIQKFDVDGVIADFKKSKTAEVAAAGWKINKGNRSDLLTKIVDQYAAGEWVGYDKEWKSTLEYLDSNGVNEGVLQKAIFSGMDSIRFTRYSYSSAPINRLTSRVESLLNSGLFDLFKVGKTNKNLTDVIVRIRNKILRNAQDMSTIQELDSYKNTVSSFLNSTLVNNALNEPTVSLTQRAVYYYLTGKPISEFFSNHVTKREFTQTPDGGYSFDYEKYKETPSLAIILKAFGIPKANPASLIIKNIESGYKFKWGDFEADALKNTHDNLKTIKDNDIKRYEAIASKILRNYNYDTTTPGSAWSPILSMAVENINVENLLEELNNTYSSIKLENLPKDISAIILKRIGEFITTKPLSSGVDPKSSYSANSPSDVLGILSKLSKLFESANIIEQYKKVLASEYTILIKMVVLTYIRYPFDDPIPNNDNNLSTYLSKAQQDDLDSYIIDEYIGKDRYVAGPISFYSNMSPQNKKKVLGYIKNGFFTRFRPIADKNLLNDIEPKDFVRDIGSVEALIPLNFDTTQYMDKILALPESKETIDRIFNNLTRRGDMTGARRILTAVSKSKHVSGVEISDYVNKFLNNVDSDSSYYVTSMVNDLQGDNFNSKDAVLLEKSLSYMDKNISKLKNEYKEFMSSAQPAFITYANFDKAAAEKLYLTMTPSMKKRMASAYMSNKEFAGLSAISAIQTGAIAPFEKLTDARIKQILKYNNVVSEETRIPDKHIRDFAAMDAYVRINKDVKAIEDLKVEEVKSTSKEMAQLTADMHRIKRSNKHGRQSLVFKRSFKVAIPMQVAAHKEWIEKDPTQQIINPMYHGTGSVAAAMILRYGFAVIKSGDSSVVGRMLGDGIYGATNIDKSQQYVGDAGFGRRVGTKGYIFEMDAALGEQGKDYKAMGLGGDGIRSPEWCVFTPNSQLLIFKAHEVEIVDESTINKILKENPPGTRMNENKSMLRFKQYLKEYVVNTGDYENYTTFTFVNGLIPMSSKGGDIVDFEDFKSPNPNTITLEPSAYGPSVVVRGTEQQNDYLFTSPTDLIDNHPEVFQEYLNYFVKNS